MSRMTLDPKMLWLNMSVKSQRLIGGKSCQFAVKSIVHPRQHFEIHNKQKGIEDKRAA